MLPKRRRTAWVNVGWRDAGGGGVRDHRVCNHAIGSVGDRAVLIYIRTDRTLRLPDHRDSGTAVPGVRPSMTSCTAAFVTLRASFVPGFAQVIDTRLCPINRPAPISTVQLGRSREIYRRRTWRSSLVRLPPRWVHGRTAHRAHLRGTHSLGSFATQPPSSTASDNPSKPVCLTVFNCV